MKKSFFVSLLLIALPVYASHIVGGEFELLHIAGYSYQLNMVLYFDDINGNPGALDQIVNASVYRKRDNFPISGFTLSLVSRTRVAYSQPACTTGSLQTDRILYSAMVTLSPDIYNDPDGYYISWQRCCRNYSITNIYSEAGGSRAAGQTFYMEFPPVVKNGQPFVNSSPHLFPPLSDYACPGRPYFVNFAGVDDDGDSIAYSLTTPLNTKTPDPLPVASPGPYPDVLWRPGYSLNNIIGGSPDLAISPDGLLTCKATKVGLFVFAVRAVEYRNGIKIGETRRDFQMLVVDGCQPDQPPVITGKKLTDATFSYVKNMNVSFLPSVADGDRCIVVQVSDPDTNDPLHNNQQKVTIKAVALNFRGKDVTGILPSVTTASLINGSTREFRICFPPCPFINAPYQIGIVAYDDACSLPMTDTLKILVNQPTPPNANAYFLPEKKITAQLFEGQSGSWPFTAVDPDGDFLNISLINDGFSLANVGMNFTFTRTPGNASGAISWNANCKNFEFSKKKDFTIKVLVDDDDKCKIVHYDTVVYHLNVVLPKLNPKVRIYSEDGSQDLTSATISMNLGHIGLDIIGTDTDVTEIDSLTLSLLSATGSATPDGYNFASASGFHFVESKFTWDPSCAIFQEGNYSNDYTLKFMVANEHCKSPIADTAFVKINIKDLDAKDEGFLPSNVITTFPDHCNDFFAIEGFEGEPECSGQNRSPVLPPPDNCTNRFEHVRIYDRWGKQVFASDDRKFRWYAANEAAGVYYYVLYFTKNKYKSAITVIH
ncbi:hypothetical protein WSM22_19990 [Cytophagales bacterium WSM2-2]|nr:hypothetical protein WSM22_19990 [Cytophagales bacterium WSM2-2]